MVKETGKPVGIRGYASVAIPHLQGLVERNDKVMKYLVGRLAKDVKEGKSLLVFGSGHSVMFPMELYHRAGGASFVIPIFADYLMPTAGPSVVRVLERTPGVATPILQRAEPRPGEMLWLASQSGINSAAVDLAIVARKMGMTTVAFTSIAHSKAVKSRHPSNKRLFEVCDRTVDLGGVPGDASVALSDKLSAGPLSTLGSVFLGHSILVAACARLEADGVRCVYTSVNTPEGEARNQLIEKRARKRDPLLR
jgi:uncharacterized phosphosugar-binding protein